MSARGFRSVFMVGGIAATALSCYMVSLRVASERAALESVENKIVLAQRDIRLLETEIGTRGRLAQLERWNVKVIRLSAPTADQFVESSFQLATLTKPEAKPAVEAPIVLASAPAPERRQPVVTSDDGRIVPGPTATAPLGELMHVVGYKKPEPRTSALVPATPRAAPAAKAAAKATAVAIGAKPPATKSAKSATADPLAPLLGAPSKAKSDAAARAAPAAAKRANTKDTGSRQ